MKRFIFTCGDINGIGPELVIKTLNKVTARNSSKFVFAAPLNVFEITAADSMVSFDFDVVKKSKDIYKSSKKVIIYDLGKAKQQVGSATKESGRVSFLSIQKSFELLKEQHETAMITAPISKTSLLMAGINFPGHTEMVAEWCNRTDYVMTFLSKKMIAALLTIHIPIKDVSKSLKKNEVIAKLRTIISMLQNDLGISQPKIALLGLNPHAGELGIMGREEQELLNPLINSREFEGKLFGTFSPDAFFANKLHFKYDAVIGCYHDQVLIPFKMLNFSSGVNYTAGLPIIRTSPDHGTAFDIAGKNIADPSSTLEAFYYAQKILNNRLANEKKIISKPYEALSIIYDHLMKNVRYDFWAEYIHILVKDYIPKRPKVLELAAGNLKFAKRIKSHFKNIIVSDLSFNMLNSSRGIKLNRVCCDMTLLPFKQKFDLVISSYDSVNYLTSKTKLLALFKEVEKVLNPEGVFTFDVVLESNCIAYEKFANRKGTYKGIEFEQISNYDKEKKFHKNIFNIFMPTGESVTEVHKQKIFPFFTYFEVIAKTNLYVVDCYKTFTFEKGDQDSDRIQFILKRSTSHGKH